MPRLRFYLSCGYQLPDEIVKVAAHAEWAGFDGITLSDHVFLPVSRSSDYPDTATGKPVFDDDAYWPDVWVTVGAVAAATSRIKIRSVYLLPLRHPILAARAAGTAAIVSGGRLELNIGAGWLRDEFDALGVDFRLRGALTNEAMEAIRALWHEGPVQHSGRHFQIGPLYMLPAPAAPVPLFVAGDSPAAFKRAARLGDGYYSFPRTHAEIEEIVRTLRALRAEYHPDEPPDRFTINVQSKEAVTVDDYRRLEEMGVASVAVRAWPLVRSRVPPVQERLAAVERFAETIISGYAGGGSS
jgi:probable F420-dependent oxidoreductase